MPGKPRKPPAGFLNPHQLAAIAKQRGISLSVTGLKRQILKGKIIPDAYENRSYKPSPLFSEEKLEHWLQQTPTIIQPHTTTETTTYEMLQNARTHNPRIHLSHIQQFLKHAATSHPELAAQIKIEKHGKHTRQLIPTKLAELFLETVRQNRLAGLFVGYGAHHRSTPPQPRSQQPPKTIPPIIHRPDRLLPNLSIPKKQLPFIPTHRPVEQSPKKRTTTEIAAKRLAKRTKPTGKKRVITLYPSERFLLEKLPEPALTETTWKQYSTKPFPIARYQIELLLRAPQTLLSREKVIRALGITTPQLNELTRQYPELQMKNDPQHRFKTQELARIFNATLKPQATQETIQATTPKTPKTHLVPTRRFSFSQLESRYSLKIARVNVYAKMKEGQRNVTFHQAAELIGCNPGTIKQLVEDGHLPANTWSEISLEKIREWLSTL